jgi:hypothetical protein
MATNVVLIAGSIATKDFLETVKRKELASRFETRQRKIHDTGKKKE